MVPPVQVGILLCADAYTPEAAKLLHAQDAHLLVDWDLQTQTLLHQESRPL